MLKLLAKLTHRPPTVANLQRHPDLITQQGHINGAALIDLVVSPRNFTELAASWVDHHLTECAHCRCELEEIRADAQAS